MQVYINGVCCPVYQNEIASYIIYCAKNNDEKTVKINICMDGDSNKAVIRPLSAEITPEVDGKCIDFEAAIPCKLSLEFEEENRLPMFFFIYLPEVEVEADKNIRYYGVGEHNVGDLIMNSGDVLYIAEGAVLHAHIFADKAENITVCGRGRIDLEGYSQKGRRLMRLHSCKNVTLKDVTFTGSYGWSCMLSGCEKVTVDGINIMTWRETGDGIDIVGSHDVSVQNCFIRTADDCIAIKATNYCGDDGLQNVYNVKISDCVMWNARPGNGIEIGFETRCDEIYNIEFSDIDIIHCEHEGWQSGGTITIHNGDRAKVHDIIYRNIRVEDSVDKLFDFKVLKSNYSKDELRGSVENILVENVSVVDGAFPPSILSGYEPDGSLVKNIRFINVCVHGRYIENITECRMIAERTKEIVFEVKNDTKKQ